MANDPAARTHACRGELGYASRLTAEGKLRLVSEEIERVWNLLREFGEHFEAIHPGLAR